jgi:hypothetical protein
MLFNLARRLVGQVFAQVATRFDGDGDSAAADGAQ